MTNPFNRSAFQAASASSLVLAMLFMTPDASAQRTRKSQRPPSKVAQVQFQSPVTPVELPGAAYESTTIIPSASDVVVPAIDNVVPSYDAAIPDTSTMSSPIEAIPSYPEYPSEYPIAQGGEVIVDNGNYQQGSQYTNNADAPAPVYSTGTWFNNGNWYGSADMVWLTRSMPEETLATSDPGLPNTFNNLGNVQLLNDIVNFDFAPGVRLQLGRFLGRDAANRDYMLEIGYLGGFGWDESGTVVSRGGNRLDSLLGGISGEGDSNFNGGNLTQAFYNNDQHRFDYESDLNSFELNYRIRTRPGRDQLAMQPDGRWVRHGVGSQMRSILAGLRFVSMSEALRLTATSAGSVTSTVTTPAGATQGLPAVLSPEIPDITRGRFAVQTDNDMFGFQIGGELTEKYDEWTWGVRGKVGGLINFAGRQTLINSDFRNLPPTVVTTSVDAVDANNDPLFLDADGVPTTERFDPADPLVLFERATDSVETSTFDPNIRQETDARDSENFTFLAEVGLYGTYQIRPNFHFKAGYDLILLAGVGLAGNNASWINGFGEFNDSSSTFLHGGSFGFETTW